MDQVSRPMLIALAATVILAALWLVALRPKPPQVADTPAAPVTAIDKAKEAAAAAEASNATRAGVADGPAATPAATTEPKTGGATAPAATPAAPAATATPTAPAAANGREAAVVRDIRAGKVVVMLFWNPKGADDVATRGAVRELSRHGGKVAVHVVPISRVGQYESITRGVTVNQSPTTLVIDKQRRSRAIVGLTESGELSQAVNDALAGRR